MVFCILQYKAMEDTIECVNSIINMCEDINYHIVIVDNYSPDNSVEIINKRFSNNENISIIENSNNLGFAKGNNIAIKYARKKFQFDYLIVLNNDIKLLEKGLYEKIKNEYQVSNFALLGPLIYTKDGRYTSNPSRKELYNVNEVKERISREKKLLWLNQIDVFGVLNALRRFRLFLLQKTKHIDSECYIVRQENIQLHGCFLIFSPKFFEKFNGFDESTFMYMEEYFLFKHLSERHLKTVYSPEIRIFHKEDASTDQAMRSNRMKEIFIHKNSLDSAKKLLVLYQYYGNHK